MRNQGKVYIIGAGPGDPKLATLKAVECISKADVIVYDRLVQPGILRFARENAQRIYAGKMPDNHPIPQEEINEILVKNARDGKIVARVKGGDPFLFGRGAEEGEALYHNGIEFEVVPGVTSAIAAPAYAGIPVTHRGYASSVHIITGHENPDKESKIIDYENLAKLSGTLIFLMGINNIQEISENLIKYGKDPDTPAAVVQEGTTADQRSIACTLKEIAEQVREAGIRPPAVIIIGEVVGLRDKLKWFYNMPLSGKRVIVTRSKEQASTLVNKIEELGGEAVEFPVIKIEEIEDFTYFDEALLNISRFNWLIFTSVNGVRFFFRRMREKGTDVRTLCGIKLCAVGDATAAELKNLGLIAEIIPEEHTDSELLKDLLRKIKPGEKVLLARADSAGITLPEGLKENNIDFEEIAVYKNSPQMIDRDKIIQYLKKKRVDFITFASSSAVKSFYAALGEENQFLISDAHVICIGSVTAKTARDIGIKANYAADRYTIDGLVNKIAEISQRR